jgi:hypothetical protein
MVDAAREILDRLVANGWPVVQDWVSNREPETNRLEFKLKGKASASGLDDEDLENLATSLSAFANQDGGLLVIGVYAGGGGARGASFDRAQHLKPVPDVEAFGGLVERRIKGLTDPAIGGVAVHAVKNPAAHPSGVLAVYVPPKDDGPYQAAGATAEVNGRYYMRTAAGAKTMSASQVAGAYGRSPRPKLSLVMRFRARGMSAAGVEVRLRNEGRGVARQPAIQFVDPPREIDWRIRQGQMSGMMAHENAAGDGVRCVLLVSYEREVFIYPKMDLLAAHFPFDDMVQLESRRWQLRLRGSVYAADAQPIDFDKTIDSGDSGQDRDKLWLMTPEDDGGAKP